MEDFISSVDEVDWYVPEYKSGNVNRQRWSERLSRRFLRVPWNPAYRMPPIEVEYDVFYVQCMFVWDLAYIGRIPDWSKKIKKSVIYITELFQTQLDHYPILTEVLKRFDLVITAYTGTEDALQKRIGVKTVFCTSGVDALKSAPDPAKFHRPVELHSMGRCNKVFFREFQKLVDQYGWTYIYNTFHLSVLHDYRMHRKYLSDILKRTLFFEVNPAKFDEELESKNQHEVGNRYFEGIAAGCVLVGLPNNNPTFKKIFPWDDILIQLPEVAEDIVPFILDLFNQRERLEHISRMNSRGALLYHDFAYRWEFTLKQAGLEPTDTLLRRKEQLSREAEKFL